MKNGPMKIIKVPESFIHKNDRLTNEEDVVVISAVKVPVDYIDVHRFVHQTYTGMLKLDEYKKIVFNLLRMGEDVLFCINQYPEMHDRMLIYVSEAFEQNESVQTVLVCLTRGDMSEVEKYMNSSIKYEPIERVSFGLTGKRKRVKRIVNEELVLSDDVIPTYNSFYYKYKLMLYFNSKKYKFIKKMLETTGKAKTCILANTPEFARALGVANFRNVKKKDEYACFVVDYDENVDLNEFQKVYLFDEDCNIEDRLLKIEGLSIKTSEVASDTMIEFLENRPDLIRQIKRYLEDSDYTKPIFLECNDQVVEEIQNQLEEQIEDETSDQDVVVGEFVQITDKIQQLKCDFDTIETVRIGSAFFPMNYSKGLLTKVLQGLKLNLGNLEFHVQQIEYLEEFRTTGTYYGQPLNASDFYFCRISVGSIFDKRFESKHHIKKKDCVNQTAVEILQFFYENRIVNQHMQPQLAELYATHKKIPLESAENVEFLLTEYNETLFEKIDILLQLQYKTCDHLQIQRIKTKFIDEAIEGFKEKMLEEKGFLRFSYEGLRKKSLKQFEKKQQINVDELWSRRDMVTRAKAEEQQYTTLFNSMFESFCSKTEEYTLYAFKNSQVGILTNGFFEGECSNGSNSVVSLSNSIKLDPDQVHLLTIFQYIFFKDIGTSQTALEEGVKKFHYYAVPIKDNQVDFEYVNQIFDNFMLDSLYKEVDDTVDDNKSGLDEISLVTESNRTVSINKDDSVTNTINGLFTNEEPDGQLAGSECLEDGVEEFVKTNLLWNVKTKTFLVWHSEIDICLESKISGEFHRDYVRNLSKIVSEEETFCDYFQRYLSVKLMNKRGRHLFLGTKLSSLIKHNGSNQQTNFGVSGHRLLPKEMVVITPISREIVAEMCHFVPNFHFLQSVYLVEDFMDKYVRIDDTSLMLRALTKSSEPDANYECLEFLGDCVLKFLLTCFTLLNKIQISPKNEIDSKHLFKQCIEFKDSTITNAFLSQKCVESNIHRYIQLHRSKKEFQAPFLDKNETHQQSQEYMAYFGVTNNFNTRVILNDGLFIQDESEINKMHADVIESVIGAIFLQRSGSNLRQNPPIFSPILHVKSTNLYQDVLQGILSFLLQIGLFDGTQINIDLLNMFKSDLLLFPYHGLLTDHQSTRIADLFHYTFSNPGLLEKVLVHSGNSNGLFGSTFFNFLELIGDSVMDLMVVEMCYFKAECRRPIDLHSHKKSYVNNISLGNITKRLGIDKLATRTAQMSEKAYGDTFEALMGAIFVDIGMDVDAFSAFYRQNIRAYVMDEQLEVEYT
ncbi:DCL1 [Enterospora canceri]|uniref:DCL1 n=1 Tax=Enterospora canceri TaxID=1081671 RepID=A0A1Y1S6J0_9MICR|nr:DCL1 [Enterospora canceri]